LPAILVYKKGELIGNFVRLTDEFGDDMYPADIESFLVEYVYVDYAVIFTTVLAVILCLCIKLWATQT